MGRAVIASCVMAPVHCLFGLHIVRRGLIFIDLAVAQVAALGVAFASIRGYDAHDPEAHWIGLSFGLAGAFIIALTRFRLGRVPHEAIIGVVFVVASAASILLLHASPLGAEELRNLLANDILFMTNEQILEVAKWYLGIIIVLIFFWKRISRITLSEENEHNSKRIGIVLMDFVFYALLAVVVTSSVKYVGVLLVFTWLVMPAVLAFFWVDKLKTALFIALPCSLIGSAGGLALSYNRDWPTTSSIVVFLGGMVAIFYIIRLIIPVKAQTKQNL